jgi:hypothetical protein
MNNFSTLQSIELTDWHLAHRLMSIAFVMRIQGDEQYIEMEFSQDLYGAPQALKPPSGTVIASIPTPLTLL